MKFQLLIYTKISTNKKVSCSKSPDVVFIMLINVKMPTIVDILTFEQDKFRAQLSRKTVL